MAPPERHARDTPPAISNAGRYGELEKQLVQLIDAESKKALDLAQEKVNEALKLPPAGSGSGSGSGSAK